MSKLQAENFGFINPGHNPLRSGAKRGYLESIWLHLSNHAISAPPIALFKEAQLRELMSNVEANSPCGQICKSNPQRRCRLAGRGFPLSPSRNHGL